MSRVEEYEKNTITFSSNLLASLKETQELFNGEDKLFNKAIIQFSHLRDNQFIQTADEEAVAEYEKMYGASYQPGDSLATRRSRVITILSSVPPFTYRYLTGLLDSMLGSGMYELDLNYDTLDFTLTTHTGSRGMIEQVWGNVIQLLPANIEIVVNNIIQCYNKSEREMAAFICTSFSYIIEREAE